MLEPVLDRAAFRRLILTSRAVQRAGHFLIKELVRVRCRGAGVSSLPTVVFTLPRVVAARRSTRLSLISNARMYCAAARAGTYFTPVAGIPPAATKDIVSQPPNCAVGADKTKMRVRINEGVHS
jgi:hypothetical protein